MRLIARTVYRAFPELDGFDDASCRRFVRAACASRGPAALRAIAVSLVGGGLGAASVALIWSMGRTQGREPPGDLAVLAKSGAALTVLLFLSLALALLTRDMLVRFGIRRVLARSGRCSGCGYSLLGVPGSRSQGEPDADVALHITCPECGTLTAADPALGELISEGAATVYRPIVAGPSRAIEQSRFEAARRRRRCLGVAAAAVCVVALAGYGLLWLQAIQARRAPGPGPAIVALRASLRDIGRVGGPVGDEEAARRWTRLMLIVDGAHEVAQGREPGGPDAKHSSRLVPLVLDSDASISALAVFGVNTRSERVAAEALALRAWQIARDRGLLAGLRGLPGLVGASRPVTTAATSPPAWAQTRDLHAAHEILQVELEMARRAGDRRAYVAAVASMRAMHLILAQQAEDDFPLASGLYSALRSHLPRVPDRDWLAEVVEAAGEPPGIDPYLPARQERVRIEGRALIDAVFSNPHVPIQRLVGMDARFTRTFVGVGVGSPLMNARWIGTYAGNIIALERAVGSLGQLGGQTPQEPSRPLPLTGMPVADMVLQWRQAEFVWRHSLRAQAHRQWLEMKVELFRLEHGRLPESWAQVLGRDADERLWVDPATGAPLIIRPASRSDAHGLDFALEPAPAVPAPNTPTTSTPP